MKDLYNFYMTLSEWEEEEVASHYPLRELFGSEYWNSGLNISSREMLDACTRYDGGAADAYEVLRLMRLCYFLKPGA